MIQKKKKSCLGLLFLFPKINCKKSAKIDDFCPFNSRGEIFIEKFSKTGVQTTYQCPLYYRKENPLTDFPLVYQKNF
jgi:hypothetical protein